MIPKFPNFKNLEIFDKEEIESFTNKFPPYSDFNFVSLYAWNTQENIEISKLNKNLIIKFKDYLEDSYFYSFIGNNDLTITIDELMLLSKTNKFEDQLKLLPKDNFNEIDINKLRLKYSLIIDDDNRDYILDVEKISIMQGPKLHHKKKLINRFLNQYEYKIETHNLSKNDQATIMSLFFLWERLRGKKREDTENELNATKRLFTHPQHLELTVQYLYSKEKLVGYTIFEIVSKDYAVSDFQKADPTFEGAYELLNNLMAKYLKEKGVKHINIEQDLGIEGLRRAKLDYDPTYLEKYIITNKS